MQLARELKALGQRGYNYYKGLGDCNLERFYANSFTYFLWYSLKVRRFTIACLLSYLIVVFAISQVYYSLAVSLLLAILIFASPYLFSTHLIRGKPETLFWSFAPLAFFLLIKEHYFAAGVVFSIVALMNFSVAFFVGLSLGIGWLILSTSVTSLLSMVMGMSLGVINMMFRLIPARKKMIKNIADSIGANPKTRKTMNPPRWSLGDTYLSIQYLIAVGLLIPSELSFRYILFALVPFVLHVNNQRFIRLSDIQTVFCCMMSVLFVIVAEAQSLLALLGFVNFLYINPGYFPGAGIYDDVTDLLHSFPKFSRASHPIVGYFRNLLSEVSEQSRIAVECRKEFGTILPLPYQILIQGLVYAAYEKQCLMFPEPFLLYTTNREFYLDKVTQLNEEADCRFVEELLRMVGANYIIAFSPTFVDKLTSWGYAEMGRVTEQEFSRVRWWGDPPKEDWILLKSPFQTGLVDPFQTKVKLLPNRIEIKAEVKQEYVVKFNYDPEWRAFQNGKELTVEPYSVHPDVYFMKVGVQHDGILTLKFRKRWLR